MATQKTEIPGLEIEYYISFGNETVKLTDPKTLSEDELMYMINDIAKHPEKYQGVTVVISSPFLEEMEEEGTIFYFSNFRPDENPYLSELKRRHSLV